MTPAKEDPPDPVVYHFRRAKNLLNERVWVAINPRGMRVALCNRALMEFFEIPVDARRMILVASKYPAHGRGYGIAETVISLRQYPYIQVGRGSVLARDGSVYSESVAISGALWSDALRLVTGDDSAALLAACRYGDPEYDAYAFGRQIGGRSGVSIGYFYVSLFYVVNRPSWIRRVFGAPTLALRAMQRRC